MKYCGEFFSLMITWISGFIVMLSINIMYRNPHDHVQNLNISSTYIYFDTPHFSLYFVRFHHIHPTMEYIDCIVIGVGRYWKARNIQDSTLHIVLLLRLDSSRHKVNVQLNFFLFCFNFIRLYIYTL